MKDFFLACITVSLISCGNTNSQTIENVVASDFQQKIGDSEALIIDVRTESEFYEGHINHAMNIDIYSSKFLDKVSVIRKDLPVFVYCRSGGRSSLAAVKMEKLGFSKIYNLIGGIGSWEEKQYQIITLENTPQSSHTAFSILEINKILKTNNQVLLFFGTEWCIPCKKMAPLIEEIKKEQLNIQVVSVNVDVNKELMQKYKIKTVPGFIIFKNSREIFRHNGLISKQALLEYFN